MSQQQFGPTFEPEPVPPVLDFRLPDDTPVRSSQDAPDGPINIELGGEALCSFIPQPRAPSFLSRVLFGSAHMGSLTLNVQNPPPS